MSEIISHKQTKYSASSVLDYPKVLEVPEHTTDLEVAKSQLSEFGMTVVTDVLSSEEVEVLSDKLDRQAEAERALGDLSPVDNELPMQSLSNLVNKGQHFLDLVERQETEELAGFMLGPNFLLSSLTGSLFRKPSLVPQPLHRDQGQVPATADFPAACNVFYLLDDFTAARGGTHVVPGSHRWSEEYRVTPPPREFIKEVEAPAGSVFAFDGRIWHGTGINIEGHPRRRLGAFCCLPWMRQQENWGISCLQEVLDQASSKLKRRLGLRTYGTLGMVSGTRVETEEKPSLGNYEVQIPDYLIGEDGALHPLRRSTRS